MDKSEELEGIYSLSYNTVLNAVTEDYSTFIKSSKNIAYSRDHYLRRFETAYNDFLYCNEIIILINHITHYERLGYNRIDSIREGHSEVLEQIKSHAHKIQIKNFDKTILFNTDNPQQIVELLGKYHALNAFKDLINSEIRGKGIFESEDIDPVQVPKEKKKSVSVNLQNKKELQKATGIVMYLFKATEKNGFYSCTQQELAEAFFLITKYQSTTLNNTVSALNSRNDKNHQFTELDFKKARNLLKDMMNELNVLQHSMLKE